MEWCFYFTSTSYTTAIVEDRLPDRTGKPIRIRQFVRTTSKWTAHENRKSILIKRENSGHQK